MPEPVSSIADRSHQQALDELVAMGMDIARALHRATQQGEAAVTPETAAAFDRVARAVRRCIALARVLDQPVADAAPARAAARRQVVRAVEDAIQRADPIDDGEALLAELRERLEGPELGEELAARPVEQVIADICRDLGLMDTRDARPWVRRLPADVAVLHRRAAGGSAAAATGGRPPPGRLMFPARFRGK